jgi:tRNA pseudouridine38-40 synthase
LRYFIEFSYNGKNYFGFQIQPNQPSVQQTLSEALSLILKHDILIYGAGRTDSGVHATQMFAHFDFTENIENDKIIHKLNGFLPKDIVVYRFILLHDDAHARFDAKARTYEYHIHQYKDAFIGDSSYYSPRKLDIAKMNKAAALLYNYTDFECFSKTNTDVNTFNCTITKAIWEQKNDRFCFTITADRFLRNMVRAIVGTLISVGNGKIDTTDFIKIIESKNRANAGFSVPAQGLFLTKIEYEYL